MPFLYPEFDAAGRKILTRIGGVCAEMLMDISPNFRERVDEARRKLLRDVRLRDLLTRHGVPEDRALRASINAAFQEFQAPI